MFWSVYPDTTEEQIDGQTADFYAMAEIPEVIGLTHGRAAKTAPSASGGLVQANPYRARSSSNFERIRPGYDFCFAIQFDDPAAEAETRYGPHVAHLQFAWKNCRTIWSKYFHHDFVTETVSAAALPDERIYHFDFWKLWPDADAAAVERMYEALAAMPERVPDLLRIRIGRQDPTRLRGGVNVGVKEERGLWRAANWHFRAVESLFDGYFQMEFADLEAFQRYMDCAAQIAFAAEFCVPLWSEFFTQRFERIAPRPPAE